MVVRVPPGVSSLARQLPARLLGDQKPVCSSKVSPFVPVYCWIGANPLVGCHFIIWLRVWSLLDSVSHAVPDRAFAKPKPVADRLQGGTGAINRSALPPSRPASLRKTLVTGDGAHGLTPSIVACEQHFTFQIPAPFEYDAW